MQMVGDRRQGYGDICTAAAGFMDEISRAYRENTDVPRKMFEYLIGMKDYYKIVRHDSKHFTLIYTFNLHGALNKSGQREVSAITVPLVELPSRIIALDFKPDSYNTAEMYMNNGWQLSSRIHNASTRVEPSLKFDVHLIDMPPSVLRMECRWKERKDTERC